MSEVNDNEPTSWETLIKLMEVYRMTEKLTHKWVKANFDFRRITAVRCF